MYIYLSYESTPDPLFMPSSSPSSHKILEVTKSSLESVFLLRIVAFLPVFALAINIVLIGTFVPIFSFISWEPSGVLNEFSLDPSPNFEDEIGKLYFKKFVSYKYNLCSEISTMIVLSSVLE